VKEVSNSWVALTVCKSQCILLCFFLPFIYLSVSMTLVMLKIRLQRGGRRNHPHFRVVVGDSRNGPKSGRFIEILGSYEPKGGEVTLNADRIKHWISVGAQVSGTVHNFLITKEIIEGKKINVLPKKTPIVKEPTEEEIKAEEDAKAKAEAEAEAAKAPAVEEAPAEESTEEAPVEETPAEEKEEVKEEEAPAEEEKEEEAPAEEETKEETPAE
jgi:small subunit ribosomal protein S16